MKKTFALTLTLCAIVTVAMASAPTTVTGWVTDPMCGVKHNKEGGEACVKSCSKDGKLALVTDGDSRVWAVENSEILRGHEGHHVKVTGVPNIDKGTIKIQTVAMLGGDKSKGAEKSSDKSVHGDAHKGKHTGETKKEDKKK